MPEKDNDGFVALYRELLAKPIWQKSTPEQKVILVTILLMANHAESEWEWGGQKFKVMPGQKITSLESIAREAGKGITIQNVRSALVKFQKYEFLTNESTKTGRLITIVNWRSFQLGKNKPNKAVNKEVTKTQQTGNKQVTPNNNDNNNNNDNKSIYSASELEVLAIWNAKGIVQHSETESLRKEIAKALTTFGKDKIATAIEHYITLLRDQDFYYNHTWTLEKFLKQKNGLPEFLDDGAKWIDYKSRSPSSKASVNLPMGQALKDKYKDVYL